ncbi:MAG: prlF antitoxin for toxin YhaV toxin [Thermomicrobiales bacterium]|nr:prlF antitoxin for toxin YhaV toxin [Thermomicrobiales bacterium]MEA2531208.1 prlF antitoxin for toxin YhaV toxin [Thermomicrobiales bacterium]
MRRFTSSVSPKGQVTIPAEVRKRLRIGPRDRVTFEVEGDDVRLVPGAFTLETAHASVPPLRRPMDDEELERRLKEERVAEWVGEMAAQ